MNYVIVSLKLKASGLSLRKLMVSWTERYSTALLLLYRSHSKRVCDPVSMLTLPQGQEGFLLGKKQK